MSRVLAAALLLTFAATAETAGELAVPRPPAVLSPDLTEAWVVQMQPGSGAFLSDPAARTTAFVPGHRIVKPKKTAVRKTDPRYLPQIISYSGKEASGTIVIDTDHRFLYLVLEDGKAKRYGVGVGRPGFEWAGAHQVTRKAEWPEWTPPEEMRARQPFLPASMKGGPANPLGARALYLGETLYRIHGTSEPWTIGHAVSSGCIRMRNEDVIDLYNRVKVGTRVVVS
jgi:lipoprotein-anchoring transpeptidase ErfK/SrfK